MVYQKTLIIVTTNSVKGQEPVMKVMEKNLKQTNSSPPVLQRGSVCRRSNRQYYFSTLRLLQRMSSVPQPGSSSSLRYFAKVIVCGNNNLKVFSVEYNLINKQ